MNAHPTRKPAGARHVGRWPLLVLLMGVLVTGLLSLAAYGDRETAARTEFLRLSERLAVETERRFTLPVYGLKGARGVFATGTHVGLNEFRAYVASRDLPEEFPGVRGFGFIERVQRGDVEHFVAATRLEGARGFAIKTSGSANELYVIKYIEPLADNTPAWGFDVGSEPVRRAAIEQAIASGAPTLTAPIALVQDERQGRGFLLMLPVYRTGRAPHDAAARARELTGVLFAPIVARQLLAGVTEVTGGRLDIELFAGPQARPEALLYDDDRVATTSNPVGRFSATRQIQLFGRTFTVKTESLLAYDKLHSHEATLFTALAGVALSLLAAWGTWLQATGRARIEARARVLTAELEKHARIVELTSNAAVVSDAEGRISWVNDGFTRIYGYTLEDARGLTPGELLGSGLTDPAVIERLVAGLRDGTPVTAEVLNRTKDGRTCWVCVDVQPMFDHDGELGGFLEIGIDITALKEAQRRLEASRDQAAALTAELETMALVAHHTTNAVIVTGTDGRVRWVNEGFTRITGYSAEDVLGKSPGALLQCELTDQAVVDQLRAALDAGTGYRGELVNRSKAGADYWIEIDISPIRSAEGQLSGFLAIESDVSARKAIEAALAKERAWLAHIVAGANACECEINVRTGELRIGERWLARLGYGRSLRRLGAQRSRRSATPTICSQPSRRCAPTWRASRPTTRPNCACAMATVTGCGCRCAAASRRAAPTGARCGSPASRWTSPNAVAPPSDSAKAWRCWTPCLKPFRFPWC